MSDRLANAIEDAGIDRAKAERLASTIVDLIHDNVATKGDVAVVRADVQNVETRLNASIDLVRHRLMTRLGGLAVVLSGLIVAAIHLWPPH